MNWTFVKDRPIYSQIIEQLRRYIASGELKPGDKLMSVRELAQEAGVNPNTMQRALSELERDGLLYSNRTSGRFVTDNIDIIDLVKRDMAYESVSGFIEHMRNIGFTKEEIIKLIQSYNEGDENNE